jgi:hypothetical protein
LKRGKPVHGKGEKGQSYLKLVKMFKITCSGLSFSLDEKMPDAQLPIKIFYECPCKSARIPAKFSLAEY